MLYNVYVFISDVTKSLENSIVKTLRLSRVRVIFTGQKLNNFKGVSKFK